MTVRIPQLFHEVEVSDLQKYIDDAGWALEQKVDGMRCLTVVSRTIYNDATVEFFTRGGKPLASSAAKQYFEKIRALFAPVHEAYGGRKYELVFDAEIMLDGQLVIFDLPYAQVSGEIVTSPDKPFSFRRMHLNELYTNIATNLEWDESDIKLVESRSRRDEKMLLAQAVRRMGGEGLIAKRLDAPYNEGVRVKHSLKLKFTHTADVIVTGTNVGESKHSIRGGDKINYTFAVRDDNPLLEQSDELIEMGACSGIGKDLAQVGDVIEVEYLYVGAGGKLVQPRMIRRRDDKRADECVLSQFPAYTKDVL